jgi:hypothetical protein
MPFGQTSCTLTCIQAITALHSDHWPLQSRTNLQDDIDYAWTTKNRTFCYSNVVLVDYAWATKNKTFRYSNLVLVDYAWTTKNRTFRCSNLVLVDYAWTTKNRTFHCSNLVLVDYPRTTKTEPPDVLILLNLHAIQMSHPVSRTKPDIHHMWNKEDKSNI